MVAVAMAGDMAAYDFLKDGIYYTILPGETLRVEVSCEKPGYEIGDDFDGAYYFMEWEGNTYSGDVTVPASVEWEGKVYAVTSIGLAAFHNCRNLTSVTLPESITKISKGAFACCSLKSLELPSGVEELGVAAFMSSRQLERVMLSEKITGIPGSCFSGTGSEAGNLVIGGWEHICHIGDYGLAGTPIQELTLISDIGYSVGYGAFYLSKLRKITFPPDGVGDYVWMMGCPELERVVLSSREENMLPVQISDCPKFTTFEIANPVPPVMEAAWDENELKATLEVPAGSEAAYAAAPGWKDFSRIVAIGSTSVEAPAGEARVKVSARGGSIEVSGEYERAEVFTPSGARMPMSGLAPGVYIVRVDGTARKVLVER